jgi:sulfite reductase (NADPH) hemoprotein beta-component
MTRLVPRYFLCLTIPSSSKPHTHVYAFSKAISDHLLPRSTAYHEIFLDKKNSKLVAGDALKDFEPLYGPMYLPRKVRNMMVFNT